MNFLFQFSKSFILLILVLFACAFYVKANDQSNINILPTGSAPKALEFPHFPDRMHAFVWRNWNLVPLDRLARVVDTTPDNILKIGLSMGLNPPLPVSHEQLIRSYITIIKRNWHLLPYDQLLELLDWSAEKLEFTLREDDFLFIKLGRLKPKCEMLLWTEPDEKTKQKTTEISTILKQEFPKGLAIPTDPLFGFYTDLIIPPDTRIETTADISPRFCYSYFGLYGDPLSDSDLNPYPDGYLEQLANVGVDGVWLQAVLYKLAHFPWKPELSKDYQKRLKNLNKLVDRAAQKGIKVWLYLNEPRALPVSFFEEHPDLKGVQEDNYAALCTSHPQVQEYLVDAVESVCRAVPNLAGFFSITYSENLTNCWSHSGRNPGDTISCPRCLRRGPAEVVAEVNQLFHKGIKQANSQTELIVWDWNWRDRWAKEAIQNLPKDVALMSVSEWSLPIQRGGIDATVGEYSISAIGPGPRAKKNWQIAREHGLKTIAKIQAGNTWELAAVPYIPAIKNVAQHAANLRNSNIDGLMLGWTLGGYPSPNLQVVSELFSANSTVDEALERVAENRFGQGLAPHVVSAWRVFSNAFSEFPFKTQLVYNAPLQVGPANLLFASETGYHATMVGFPYDDLKSWRSIYPAEVFISQFEKMATGFQTGLDILKAVDLSGLKDSERKALVSEINIFETATLHFQSIANQARYILIRRSLNNSTQANKHRQQMTLKEILKNEVKLAKRLYKVQTRDSRIGFEASNHYFYVPQDLLEKIVNCRWLLSHSFSESNSQ